MIAVIDDDVDVQQPICSVACPISLGHGESIGQIARSYNVSRRTIQRLD
jgi:hypothetical protein